MTAATMGQGAKWERVRHRIFYAWAATLTLLFGLLFVGVTALTVWLWFARQNFDTNPVTDLGFFALGGVIITVGLAAQWRAPTRCIAGLQQAVVGLLALGVAGLIGARIEPLVGAVMFLLATAPLAALHPARGVLFSVKRRPSGRLAALALLAAFPALPYAATLLVQARQAGPSCFLGRCAAGDRFAEMAALTLAVVALGLLAAGKPPGWRVTAWSTGLAAVIVGGASLGWPGLPGALGQVGGAAALLWGIVFVAVAQREPRTGGEVG